MARLGAAAGAGAGFGGSLFYILCSVLLGLSVGSSGTVDQALIPQTARWVSDLLAFTVYGTVTSVVFGALLGSLNGLIQRRLWGSRSPLLSWVIGTVINFLLVFLVHLLLDSRGFSTHLAVQLRFVSIPSMIFVLEGGVVGLWITQQAQRMVDTAQKGDRTG
jgi:hypothetical protein